MDDTQKFRPMKMPHDVSLCLYPRYSVVYDKMRVGFWGRIPCSPVVTGEDTGWRSRFLRRIPRWRVMTGHETRWISRFWGRIPHPPVITGHATRSRVPGVCTGRPVPASSSSSSSLAEARCVRRCATALVCARALARSLVGWLLGRDGMKFASPIASANRLCRVIIRAILLFVGGILPGYISSIRVGDLVGFLFFCCFGRFHLRHSLLPLQSLRVQISASTQ
jgi:hypothetical protein